MVKKSYRAAKVRVEIFMYFFSYRNVIPACFKRTEFCIFTSFHFIHCFAKNNPVFEMSDEDRTVDSGSIVKPDQPPAELDLSKFLYESVDVSGFINVAGWSQYFDEIPADPYVKEGYRYKSISWFRIKHQCVAANDEIDKHIAKVNQLSGMNGSESNNYVSTSRPSWQSAETGYCSWNLPQYALQQSILYNPVHGDLRREYPRISNNIVDSEDFHRLLINYAAFFGWSDSIVLVQFQRVDCLADRIGLPAVEGFHQDGNRHVGMLVVTRKNITGDSGVSQYVLDDHGKKTEELIFNSVIQPGELIYWNDKRVWHYGTELKLADKNVNGGRGVRDIIILSAKTPPANMPMGPVPERFRTYEE